MMGLFQELQRRNVIRVGIAYAVTAWLLLQIADVVLDNIGAPLWVMQSVMLVLALGFPLALIFAWAFELTPEGLKRERDVDRSQSMSRQTGRKLDFAIIGLLAVVALYFIWEARFQDGQVAPQQRLHRDSAQSGPETTANIASIAVLPFLNLSSDPEQEYFSDGISEELLNVLAQFPDLRVAARTSSFQFKGENRDIGDIARQLKVNHILEGSVRKAGKRLRITAQLIEVENGYHLWSASYDRELEDIFAIQDEISTAIGEALRSELNLAGGQRTLPRVAEAANTAAYEAYLHGRYLINQRGNRAITEAVQLLEKSIRLDPEYAPAHAQLAIAYALLLNDPSTYGDLTVAEVNGKATPHLDKAMRLNPRLAETWGARTMLAQANDDYAQAIDYAEQALALNPAYIDAMNWINTAALFIGEYRKASAYMERLIEVDPLSVVGRMNYAGTFLAASEPERATAIAQELVAANAWAGNITLSHVSAAGGQLADAVAWALKAFERDPVDTFSNRALTRYFAEVGLRREALRISDNTRMFAATTVPEFASSADDLSDRYQRDPGNSFLLSAWVYSAYYAGRHEQALALSREQHENWKHGLPVAGGYGTGPSLRYAWLLQQAGDSAAAGELLARIERNLDAKAGTRFALNRDYPWDRGRLALLRGDPEALLETITGMPAHRLGPLHELRDPMLAPLADDSRYRDAVERYRHWVAGQRAEVLALICHHNPVPEAWQPLAATCSGADATALRADSDQQQL
jgi:TolB-like protein/Tfp pilus assembly protein PilF